MISTTNVVECSWVEHADNHDAIASRHVISTPFYRMLMTLANDSLELFGRQFSSMRVLQ